MTPKLSVIITCYNAQNTIVACLESLERQKTDDEFEIIVVDSSNDGTADIIEKQFPRVRLYRFSERKFCGGARNWGVSVAESNIVAFIDADCIAERNWVEEILKAHQTPDLIIGGAIVNGADTSLVGWAAYFTEFSHLMPNLPGCWLADVAGANMSYKCKVFEEFGRFIEGTYCSDTDFHWRIAKGGHRPRFEPSIIVRHDSISSLSRLVQHEFEHGRYFGRVRVKSQRWSKSRRVIYSLLSILIPVKLFLEITLRNIKNKIYFLSFMKAIPLLFVALYSWSAGECAGYLHSKNMKIENDTKKYHPDL